MPKDFVALDTGFPNLTGKESTEEKVDQLYNYTYMLLENLRYILRNLSPTDNFNEKDLKDWVDTLEIQTLISNTVITNELYAYYGEIADLTVDKLRTDYIRARNFLAGITGDIDYISIHDEEISFITARTDGTQFIQYERDGMSFYWTDASYMQMTTQKATNYPVYVYVYEEMVKGSIKFQQTYTSGGESTVMPVITLGAGTGDPTGTWGKATIKKTIDALNMVYRTSQGIDTGVYMRDDGFTDVTQRRASIEVDTANHAIIVTPEGTLADSFTINFTEAQDGTMTLTWPDNKQFTVKVD